MSSLLTRRLRPSYKGTPGQMWLEVCRRVDKAKAHEGRSRRNPNFLYFAEWLDSFSELVALGRWDRWMATCLLFMYMNTDGPREADPPYDDDPLGGAWRIRRQVGWYREAGPEVFTRTLAEAAHRMIDPDAIAEALLAVADGMDPDGVSRRGGL